TSDPDMIRRINAGAAPDLTAIEPGANGELPADIVNGEYQNRRFASFVPRSVFLAGRAVAPALIELPERRLDNAPLLAGSPRIAPAAPRAAVMASSGVANSAAVNSGRAKLAAAVQALSRILAPRAAMAATRASVPARTGPGRATTIVLKGRATVLVASPHQPPPRTLA